MLAEANTVSTRVLLIYHSVEIILSILIKSISTISIIIVASIAGVGSFIDLPQNTIFGDILQKIAQGAPVQSFQHKKAHICLILITFWDEITFGYITRWLGADFKETHFFQRRPVLDFNDGM